MIRIIHLAPLIFQGGFFGLDKIGAFDRSAQLPTGAVGTIEYGVTAAYAEGLNIIRNANAGKVKREVDAETTPLRNPELYQYDVDLAQVAEVWRRGSVIGSWLLAAALRANPDLSNFSGRVSDSGEGRWTLQAAIDEGIPAPVISSALFTRLSSRGAEQFEDRSCRPCATSLAATSRSQRPIRGHKKSNSRNLMRSLFFGARAVTLPTSRFSPRCYTI